MSPQKDQQNGIGVTKTQQSHLFFGSYRKRFQQWTYIQHIPATPLCHSASSQMRSSQKGSGVWQLQTKILQANGPRKSDQKEQLRSRNGEKEGTQEIK